MSDTELVNGLRHMADDHPCCEATILHAIDKLQQLEQENAALREVTSTLGAPNHINVPVEQWRELRADKERLDWIAKNRSVSVTERPLAVTPDSLRGAIDAARKEAQP